ncbi:MAG: hypothetical protein ACTTJ9_10250 [Segatella oris]|uniref:hypothetical protein n=1 Tax=Segatella oris TaxID=28135 RepID=UPI003FA2E4F4
MKIRQFLFAACTALVLTACSKDAIDNGHANAVEIDNITITEEPFEPETPAKSSAKQTRAAQAPQIVDLGDGLIAEVSLTEDAHEETPVRTRAAIADGHYTIYASIPGGAMPNTGILKATLSGTVQGGKFVRDASSSPMRLDPGTYTFVCVNDALPLTSGGFELKNDLDNPMMATVTMPISGDFVEIPFVMKHRELCRVRFRITSYTAEGHGITGKLSFSSITVEDNFDIEGRWFGAFPTAFTSGTYTFAESPVTPSAYTQITKRTTDYRYFISGAQGANAHFTIDGGSIYGKSLAGKSFPLTAIANLQENKSYTCNIKLKPAVLYLFQDGTVGTLADKGSRTPIGVVVREKTATKEGMAVALKYVYPVAWSKTTGQKNTVMTSDFNTMFNSENGYEQTYDASLSTLGKAHADNPDMPAFYTAAHYTPTLNIPKEGRKGRWFLPSMGQWKLLIFNLYKSGNKVEEMTTWGDVPSLDPDEIDTVDKYFTEAGGDKISDDYFYFHSSNQMDIDKVAHFYIRYYGAEFREGYNQTQAEFHLVRPFIYF